MKIAVDCRYIGMSGIGRVCEGILDNLDYENNEFYLFGKAEQLKKYERATVIPNDTDPYSVKGLFSFRHTLVNSCDAFFVPNFLIPFGIKIPVFTVMHDLFFLDLKVTTKGVFDRTVKRYLLKRGMKKSARISCVSAYTLSRCKAHYSEKLTKKCYVNYNGLSRDILEREFPNLDKSESNTLVYVGNVKPHKGLKTLIDAYKLLENGKYKLKIIGEKDSFKVGLDENDLAVEGVEFTGKLSGNQLVEEIEKAKFLVQPSLCEGFGIPPLEAMWLGTKPIVSDIPVFKEVYSEFPVQFFETGNAEDLKQVIENSDPAMANVRERITNAYSYEKTAKKITETIREYVKSAN